MIYFQIITLPLIVILFAVAFARLLRYRRAWNLFWTVLWVAAGVAIAYPDVTVIIAHTLGIGRGADLILYLFVLCASIGFFLLYTHLQRVQTQLTVMVRQFGIQQTLAEQQRAAQENVAESQA